MKKMMILLPLLLLSAQQCHSMNTMERQSRGVVDQVIQAILVEKNFKNAQEIMTKNKGNFDINQKGYFQNSTILSAALTQIGEGNKGFVQFINKVIALGASPTQQDIQLVTGDILNFDPKIQQTATKVLDMLVKAKS